ncbi:MAG: heparinase II/III family protein, partial [Candidatus Tectomicrobia bacterium]|nr:heparinase II/III family protein [Candidatus Tectomicrobia bacterium]
MPAREWRHRLRQRALQTYERWMSERAARPMTDAALWRQLEVPQVDHSAAALWERDQSRHACRFFLHRQPADELRQLILTRFPHLALQARQAAQAVLQHRFRVLGVDVQYGDHIAWQADPVSGAEWPRKFYADVPLSQSEFGDVKHVWELNRHQYVVDLGKAYWLTGEQVYADAFMRILSHWVAANPYGIGVNWTNALEPAYRVLSWLWTHALCREGLTPEFHLRFLKTLYQQARYIESHLEVYSSPYNHLAGEAAALVWIGTRFPDFKLAPRWAARGWGLLDAQLDAQLHADGFSVEQASFYHHATLEFYLLAALLRELNGEPVRAAIWERIEQAISASVFLTQPDGTTPHLGDCDDARPIRLSHRPVWDFRDVHALGAVLFQRPDFKFSAGAYAEEALWLLGVEGYQRFMALPAEPPTETSKAFSNSGHYLMRSGWGRQAHWGCFDCGPQSAGLHTGSAPSAAHGHADALSVLLTVGGEPMLVDAGSYTYNGDPAWRDYFHQTRAHNTVVVDGQNQAVHHGGMAWSHAARVRCEAWVSTTEYDYVCGSHDGYRRLTPPVLHRRAVLFRKSWYWLIFDEIDGAGEQSVESYLHVAPCTLDARPDGFDAHFVSGQRLGVRLAGASFNLDVITDSSPGQPESGWIGTHYGARRPAPVVRWHAQLQLPQRWGMLLAWQAGDWRLEHQEGVFVVRGPASEDRYVWREDVPLQVGQD